MASTLLNLTDLEMRTGIARERLRYILDQKLLPGLRGTAPVGSSGRGVPRVFSPFEAFGVACAALLLETGLRRQAVADCMDVICAYEVPGSRNANDVPIFQAFQQRDAAYLEVGDGAHVRIYGSPDYRRRPLAFGWRKIATGEAVEGYEPLVVVQINVRKLRKCLV
jgi:hypothetical protein